ncbi:hypothetical protein XELAEV_18047304mg [Xenopus laevis]|uniref:Uncharacterized protein n=1 Tax=Xenopus laevis TaxID=8355 RepID=A0A974H1S0_XENLA|nr:hypothetical protein XELAEV_18047304mg [Xenopus laevis]
MKCDLCHKMFFSGLFHNGSSGVKVLSQLVSLASNDGSVKLLCVTFNHNWDYLISGGSDGTVRIWS